MSAQMMLNVSALATLSGTINGQADGFRIELLPRLSGVKVGQTASDPVN
jgi:hypothetical protein